MDTPMNWSGKGASPCEINQREARRMLLMFGLEPLEVAEKTERVKI
jgi:hypothetical protein